MRVPRLGLENRLGVKLKAVHSREEQLVDHVADVLPKNSDESVKGEPCSQELAEFRVILHERCSKGSPRRADELEGKRCEGPFCGKCWRMGEARIGAEERKSMGSHHSEGWGTPALGRGGVEPSQRRRAELVWNPEVEAQLGDLHMDDWQTREDRRPPDEPFGREKRTVRLALRREDMLQHGVTEDKILGVSLCWPGPQEKAALKRAAC